MMQNTSQIVNFGTILKKASGVIIYYNGVLLASGVNVLYVIMLICYDVFSYDVCSTGTR